MAFIRVISLSPLRRLVRIYSTANPLPLHIRERPCKRTFQATRKIEAPVHDIGERQVFGNPAVKVISSVSFSPRCFTASLTIHIQRGKYGGANSGVSKDMGFLSPPHTMKGNSAGFTRPPGRRAWLIWSIRPTKSLTYIPMRAWANKTGEMYAYPGRNRRALITLNSSK